MPRLRTIACAALAGLLAATLAASTVDARKARELNWRPLPSIKGGFVAPLWENHLGSGALHRLAINQPFKPESNADALRVLVLFGGLGVEIDQRILGEFGPGSSVTIPAGSACALTATAAGECTFLLIRSPGARVEAAGKKGRDHSWQPLAAIKGAFSATLWSGTESSGALHRLAINQPHQSTARGDGARLVVLLGAITVAVDQRILGEFGPGSFVSIPGGARYSTTATAAGECTYLVHSDGADVRE